jgi:hypothetical protein
MRLVRGHFTRTSNDRFDVESNLFDIVLAYERLAENLRDPGGERGVCWRVYGSVLATPRRR